MRILAKPGSQGRSGEPALDEEARPNGATKSWSQPNGQRAEFEVLANLRLLILNAGHGRGDRLPFERDFVFHPGVGRPAVREAIKAPCMLEVLDSRRGANFRALAVGAHRRTGLCR